MNARLPVFAAFLATALAVPAARADTLRVPQDFPTIQAAVDVAVEGDVVLVSKGSYPGNVTIVGKSGIELRGKGKAVIEATGPGPALSVVECTGVLVRGIHVTGAVGGDGSGISVNDSSKVTLLKCTAFENEDDGFQGWDSTELAVEKCRALDNGDEGVQFWNVVHGRVERNIVIDTGHEGMDFETELPGPMDLFVARNRIVRPTWTGIYFLGIGAEIERNRVIDPHAIGMYLSSTGSLVERNVITRAGGDGLVLAEAYGDTLEKNRVLKPGGDGYDLLTAGGLFEKNVSTKASECGFHVRTGDNTFRKNKALKSALYDLMDEGGGGNVYELNVFKTVDPAGQQP